MKNIDLTKRVEVYGKLIEQQKRICDNVLSDYSNCNGEEEEKALLKYHKLQCNTLYRLQKSLLKCQINNAGYFNTNEAV